MELIKANDTDIFSVAVNGSLPTKEFEFADESAIARQAYYYGVVAVALDDAGRWLPSRVSQTVVGQAYDITPPEPPVWDEVSRITNDSKNEVLLKWHAKEKLNCLVKRRLSNSEIYTACSEWIDISTYNSVEERWDYQLTDLKALQSDLLFVYQVSVRDEAGNISTSVDSSIV